MIFFNIFLIIVGLTGFSSLVLSFVIPESNIASLVSICSYLLDFIAPLGALIVSKQKDNNTKTSQESTQSPLNIKFLSFVCILSLLFSITSILLHFTKNASSSSDTIPPIVSESESESKSESDTSTSHTVDNTEQPIEPNQGNSIVNVNNNGIIYQSSSNNNGIIYQSNSDGELIIQGNKLTCTANKEHAVFSNKFPAKKNHTHRLDFKNSNVNNKYQVTIYDSSGKEVPTYNVSENGLTVEFIAKETYEIRIEVVQYDCPSEFIIEIKEPDN